MSTLDRDFGAEYGAGRDAWVRNHLEHWLEHYVGDGERAQVREDCARALDGEPSMIEWADWRVVARKGRWLRLNAGYPPTTETQGPVGDPRLDDEEL